ncbi:hypothetical protein Tco_0015720 [Tanacetum coccineum]
MGSYRKSIQNGPTPHPMVTDPPPTDSTIVPAPRKKLDSEFNDEENKLEMANTQAEIILSQSSPTASLCIDALMATIDSDCKLLSGFPKAVYTHQHPAPEFLTSQGTHATVHDGHIVTEQVQRKLQWNAPHLNDHPALTTTNIFHAILMMHKTQTWMKAPKLLSLSWPTCHTRVQPTIQSNEVYGLSANEIASNASNPATPVTPFVHNRPPPSKVLFHLQKVNVVFHQFEGSGYKQKDRKPSQNDKTEHGMEKTVQNQGQSPKMPKSESIQKNQQSNQSRN